MDGNKMSSGWSVLVAALIISSGIVVSGSTGRIADYLFDQQRAAACWSTSAINSLGPLATSVARDSFKSSIPESFSEADKEKIAQSLDVVPYSLGYVSSTSDSGPIKCYAGMSFYYRPLGEYRQENKTENIFTYTVNLTQVGYSPVMSGSDMPSGVVVFSSKN